MVSATACSSSCHQFCGGFANYLNTICSVGLGHCYCDFQPGIQCRSLLSGRTRDSCFPGLHLDQLKTARSTAVIPGIVQSCSVGVRTCTYLKLEGCCPQISTSQPCSALSTSHYTCCLGEQQV
eukprot:scpid69379/ scgid9130/ 